MDKIIECLQVLGLEPKTTREEIKKAYYKKIKKWHPDRYVQHPEFQKEAANNTKKVIEAYKSLSKLSESEIASRAIEELEELYKVCDTDSTLVKVDNRPYTKKDIDEAIENLKQYKKHLFLEKVVFTVMSIVLLYHVFSYLHDIFYQEHNTGKNLLDRIKFVWLENAEYYSIGATEEEVLRIQGKPRAINGDTWWYGLSSINFKNGRVKSYSNTSNNLRIK